MLFITGASPVPCRTSPFGWPSSPGRCELSVKELFELKESSVLTLDSGTRETVDVLLDGKVVARGTLVAAGDSFGVQVTEVLAR